MKPLLEEKLIHDIFTVEKEGEYSILCYKNPSDKIFVYDPGLHHTATCRSSISSLNRESGEFFYRGISIKEKIKEDFLDVAGELIFDTDENKKKTFKHAVHKHFVLLDEIKSVIDSLPLSIHPMNMLAISITALESLEEKYVENPSDIAEKTAFITAQVGISVAYFHARLHNKSWFETPNNLRYSEKILAHLRNTENRQELQSMGSILNTIMILHAEHGQNCSTATVRNVASARGSMYTATTAGMAAFNGHIHGGASQMVSTMYEELSKNDINIDEYVDKKIGSKELLMGFGQRTYNRILNCWDPRVEVMHNILVNYSANYPEIEGYRSIALQLIEKAERTPFFKEKNLTPNPDLFNCIFYKLFGAPKEMNTTMLALGRIVGWLSNFVEHSVNRYPITRPCDL